MADDVFYAHPAIAAAVARMQAYPVPIPDAVAPNDAGLAASLPRMRILGGCPNLADAQVKHIRLLLRAADWFAAVAADPAEAADTVDPVQLALFVVSFDTYLQEYQMMQGAVMAGQGRRWHVYRAHARLDQALYFLEHIVGRARHELQPSGARPSRYVRPEPDTGLVAQAVARQFGQAVASFSRGILDALLAVTIIYYGSGSLLGFVTTLVVIAADARFVDTAVLLREFGLAPGPIVSWNEASFTRATIVNSLVLRPLTQRLYGTLDLALEKTYRQRGTLFDTSSALVSLKTGIRAMSVYQDPSMAFEQTRQVLTDVPSVRTSLVALYSTWATADRRTRELVAETAAILNITRVGILSFDGGAYSLIWPSGLVFLASAYRFWQRGRGAAAPPPS